MEKGRKGKNSTCLLMLEGSLAPTIVGFDPRQHRQ